MTTNPPQIVFNHIVAFEVSKEKLVVHTLPDDEQWTIDNKPQAVRRLIKAEIKRNRKKQLGQMLVICEATGGYERHVLDVAIETGLSVQGHMARVCGTLAATAVCLPKLIRSMRACLRNMVSRQRTSGSILRLHPRRPHCARCMAAGRRSSRWSLPRLVVPQDQFEHVSHKHPDQGVVVALII
jgi:transposase